MEQMSQQMIDELLNGAANVAAQNSSDLNEMEIDALGESVNISMGSAAKVLSTMLNLKVVITTPKVTVLSNEEFEYKSMFPAVGVTIKYIEGLSGLNFFVIKQTDVKKIVEIMMGAPDETPDSEFTELHISAISEVMNQMMGASSTSLATFFNRKINISTPECTMVGENDDAKAAMGMSGKIVVIKLKLKIGDIIDSEIVNVMPAHFAKELAENLINVQLPIHTKGLVDSTPPPVAQPEPVVNERNSIKESKAPEFENVQGANTILSSDENYSKPNFADFGSNAGSKESPYGNLNIIMDVPLDVIVQIGKAQKQVKDIIKLTQGSIIELEKQAGDPVDIIVNGELIAKGDVVVIDDNFGVRITEIVNKL